MPPVEHLPSFRRFTATRDVLGGTLTYAFEVTCTCGAEQTAGNLVAARTKHRRHVEQHSPAYRLLVNAVHLRTALEEASAGLTAAMCSGDTRFLVTRVKGVLAMLHRTLDVTAPQSIDLTDPEPATVG